MDLKFMRLMGTAGTRSGGGDSGQNPAGASQGGEGGGEAKAAAVGADRVVLLSADSLAVAGSMDACLAMPLRTPPRMPCLSLRACRSRRVWHALCLGQSEFGHRAEVGSFYPCPGWLVWCHDRALAGIVSG